MLLLFLKLKAIDTTILEVETTISYGCNQLLLNSNFEEMLCQHSNSTHLHYSTQSQTCSHCLEESHIYTETRLTQSDGQLIKYTCTLQQKSLLNNIIKH